MFLPPPNLHKIKSNKVVLSVSSNPNSPAVVEVKKRGRPKTIVKPVEVEPPTPEEPREAPEAPEAPEVTAETLTKAAPSKRGRKPGKKAETAGTGSGSAEQAGAVIPTDLVSEEVMVALSYFFLKFHLNIIREFPRQSRSKNPSRREGDPRK